MDSNRFDRLTKRFAASASRRSVLTGLTAGGAASALGFSRVSAQEATSTTVEPVWLFVINFSAVEITSADDGSVTIVMTGVDSDPVAFSEHPERLQTTMPVDEVLSRISAASGDPVNADLVTRHPKAGISVSLPIEILSATYDNSDSVTAQAIVLHRDGVSEPPEVAPGIAVSGLGGSLFIDGVPSSCGALCANGDCCTSADDCTSDGSCCTGFTCLEADGVSTTCCFNLCDENGGCCQGAVIC